MMTGKNVIIELFSVEQIEKKVSGEANLTFSTGYGFGTLTSTGTLTSFTTG
jgi:hypothetical protein